MAKNNQKKKKLKEINFTPINTVKGPVREDTAKDVLMAAEAEKVPAEHLLPVKPIISV